MSKLHSETYNQRLGLRVRVKLVDLNGIETRSEEKVVQARLTSALAVMGETAGRAPATDTRPSEDVAAPSFEICISSGRKIPGAAFETHIEHCQVCSSRVDLQLDFIESLELAVYQRKSAPRTAKVHGAMLVSAPHLNFAICGEIEPV